MNKSLILVLAICLVSVHAFVKRNAPANAPQQNNYLEDINAKAKEFQANAEKLAKEITDPTKIKELVDQFSAGLNNVIEQLKPKEAPKS